MRHVRERAYSRSGGRCLLTCPPFLLGRAFYRSQDVCGLHRRARHSVGYVRHTEHVCSAGLLVTSSKESTSSASASTGAVPGPGACSSTASSRPRTSGSGARASLVPRSTGHGGRQADQPLLRRSSSLLHRDGEPFTNNSLNRDNADRSLLTGAAGSGPSAPSGREAAIVHVGTYRHRRPATWARWRTDVHGERSPPVRSGKATRPQRQPLRAT